MSVFEEALEEIVSAASSQLEFESQEKSQFDIGQYIRPRIAKFLQDKKITAEELRDQFFIPKLSLMGNEERPLSFSFLLGVDLRDLLGHLQDSDLSKIQFDDLKDGLNSEIHKTFRKEGIKSPPPFFKDGKLHFPLIISFYLHASSLRDLISFLILDPHLKKKGGIRIDPRETALEDVFNSVHILSYLRLVSRGLYEATISEAKSMINSLSLLKEGAAEEIARKIEYVARKTQNVYDMGHLEDNRPIKEEFSSGNQTLSKELADALVWRSSCFFLGFTLEALVVNKDKETWHPLARFLFDDSENLSRLRLVALQDENLLVVPSGDLVKTGLIELQTPEGGLDAIKDLLPQGSVLSLALRPSGFLDKKSALRLLHSSWAENIAGEIMETARHS
jgi:hypothetical protein